VLTKEEVTNQKLTQRKPPQPTIKLADPTRTAANIHAKMGAEYCEKLIALTGNKSSQRECVCRAPGENRHPRLG